MTISVLRVTAGDCDGGCRALPDFDVCGSPGCWDDGVHTECCTTALVGEYCDECDEWVITLDTLVIVLQVEPPIWLADSVGDSVGATGTLAVATLSSKL